VVGAGAPAKCVQMAHDSPLMVYLHTKFIHNLWNLISTKYVRNFSYTPLMSKIMTVEFSL
jgi:hypothetical protein